ncbi:Zn-dependent alcohol dehydrogenase [Streptomyces rhizosphaericus]|uniref:Zn-dependent alcohol dehydrogenase n=1 Tax=Streptomyces rhizosphaericus TaxID=114699 RepID=A0A6G4AVU6_9ACTN|nr:Zn-dependent alcohol dehydrogenase [Streptomyces rhizosphaericus]NEW77368.1 Zn-dependent alcohol dehydrogenase [Streptomyces rhizosphaericus]
MTEEIAAAVLNKAPGRLDLARLVLDAPGPHEVRIRVAYAGLCHSDLHEIDGTFDTTVPIVLGHEASGVVEAVGNEVTDVSPGDVVVTCPSASCGVCAYCMVGRQTLCVRREALTQQRPSARLTTLDGQPVRASAGVGAFAEKIVVHRSMVVAIAQGVPLDVASVLGCAVTTGMGAVLRSAGVRACQTVAVIGLGGVGMAAVLAARLSGARRIIGIDVQDAKLGKAKSLGATDIVNARAEDPVATVRELTGGGVDHAFEAVGAGKTVGQAFAMLRPGGAATVMGMVPDAQAIPLTGAELFAQEKQLRGSFMGSNHFKIDVPQYLELRAQGRLPLDELVTDRVKFEDINDGFELLASGTATRVVAQVGDVSVSI